MVYKYIIQRRLGTAAETTRGLLEDDFKKLHTKFVTFLKNDLCTMVHSWSVNSFATTMGST